MVWNRSPFRSSRRRLRSRASGSSALPEDAVRSPSACGCTKTERGSRDRGTTWVGPLISWEACKMGGVFVFALRNIGVLLCCKSLVWSSPKQQQCPLQATRVAPRPRFSAFGFRLRSGVPDGVGAAVPLGAVLTRGRGPGPRGGVSEVAWGWRG